MGGYENATNESERFEHECERLGIDNYTVEVNDETLLAYHTLIISTIGELLRASSSKITAVKCTELSGGSRVKQRISLLFNLEVPRSPQKTTVIKRRSGMAGKQLVIDAEGIAGSETRGKQKKRNTRLTDNGNRDTLVPSEAKPEG